MMLSEVKSAFLENKAAILAAIAILAISLILGYVLKSYLYSYLNPVTENITQKVQSGVIKLTFQDVFLNNIRIVFQMFIYGIAFCLSALVLAFNGFLVGYYVANSNNVVYTLLLIIPHGIFEFSSCILACASGFVLFDFVYRFLKALWACDDASVLGMFGNSFKASQDKLKQAIVLLIVASVLMIIAGFVEVYLTIPIAKAIVSILS